MLEHKYPDLKLEDIKVGMRVRTYQLEDIHDTYILILNPKIEADIETITATEGTVVFIGEAGADKSPEFYNTYKKYEESEVLMIRNISEDDR